ncbi:hypothetical protein FHT87_004174 [Rhizobium sp. BK316]|uniref:hypothetical protein n=1 Tax=Rhizobium sp. BK316 TaxID=2587053 RepID=UPI00160771D8|nr:hypothetical protein [Rhizobium sp. BK316]MBB3410242.1 hypothetical protein [Rhizobium sp. BK316]
MKEARFYGLLSRSVRFLASVFVALLTGLHMLLMRAAAGTRTGLIVGRRSLLWTGILVALLACLDMLFV